MSTISENIECSSNTYSDNEFELSASPIVSPSKLSTFLSHESAASTTADDFGSLVRGDGGDEGDGDSGGSTDTMPTENSQEDRSTDGRPSSDEFSASHDYDYESEFEAADDRQWPPGLASSFEDGEETLQSRVQPPAAAAFGQDRRTAKQKYLDLKRKVATVREEAEALEQRRHVEDSRARLQAQETKESWHFRIHRRRTEREWHIKMAQKTAASIVATSLYKESWTKGASRARANAVAIDAAFTSTFASLQAQNLEREAAVEAESATRAAQEAAACKNVWDASRQRVPVRRLRELMEEKIKCTRHTNPSEPFEQLCRRVEGIVVESLHPYTKGIRQELEACVPGAKRFNLAFDAASNTTAGAGKVSLLRPNDRDPIVFAARGAYSANNVSSGDGETHLPGVNGQPPLRVDGSSVLVIFSASYWRGVAAAGEDYGWRFVCFTTPSDADATRKNDGDDDFGEVNDAICDAGASAVVAAAEKAADRAEAVDAINAFGESCLHVACFEGNVAAARYLLTLDADPNSAHTAGGLNTPLHEAVRGGSLAVTRLLLKSSANIQAANAHGDLALHVACRAGRVDIARHLLAHDADWSAIAVVNHAGQLPSYLAHRSAALISLLEMANKAASTARASRSPLLTRSKSTGNRGLSLKSPTGRNGSTLFSRGGSRETMSSRSRRPFPGKGRLSQQLPRWARLPRPVGGDGALDEAQSNAESLGSGTNYAASLTEADFQIALVEEVASGSHKDRYNRVVQ